MRIKIENAKLYLDCVRINIDIIQGCFRVLQLFCYWYRRSEQAMFFTRINNCFSR